jgi:MFS transporter, FSR family, fosmidomycin resistance protein
VSSTTKSSRSSSRFADRAIVEGEQSHGLLITDRLAIGLLAAGHFSVDMCQAMVPALLPFLVASRHLSFAAAGGLVFGQTISSSIVQPLFGLLADRRPIPSILPLGIAVAALGTAAATVLPTYSLMWAAFFFAGFGVAAYHPEGARYTRYASGRRQVTAMSVYSMGGILGFAAAPTVLTPLVLNLGMSGATWACLIPALGGCGLWLGLRRITRQLQSPRAALTAAHDVNDWNAFGRLTAVLLIRTVVFFGMSAFLPLFWIAALHRSKAEAEIVLIALPTFGTVGAVIGGRLADRFSTRIVVILGSLLSGPLLIAVTVAPSPTLAMLLLVPLALAAWAPNSVIVVMGQEYLPNRIGTAVGVTTGLAFGLGGVLTPAMGAFADSYGLSETLLCLGFAPLLAAGLACTLPNQKIHPPLSRPPTQLVDPASETTVT